MYKYSVQRYDRQIYFDGLLSISAVEDISKQVREAAKEKTDKLSIFIEAKGGEDTSGAVLCSRLLELAKSPDFSEGLRTIGGQEIDSSCLAFFLAGTERLIFPTTVFHFHPSRIFATSEDNLPIYVTLPEAEQGLKELRLVGKRWVDNKALRSMLRKLLPGNDNPHVDFLHHTSTLLDQGIDCSSAGQMVETYIDVALDVMRVAASYSVEMLVSRTTLSKEAAQAMFFEDRFIDAEAALAIGLAQDYVKIQ